MLSDSQARELEVAHVLFMDVVGYSRLTMEEQTRRLAQLQNVIRDTAEFHRAEARDELLRLPTGDGMALVFFRDPVAPVRCALEIARALRSLPEMKLRMGLHSGPVYRVEDINANRNVSGGGINIAERVMDCGDVGHILLSSAIVELLRQLGVWSAFLHDLGECLVKHGETLHLFNFYTDELGNPEPPQKIREARMEGYRDAEGQGHSDASLHPAESLHPSQQVALLYKRNAQPDERLLKLLETRLQAEGYQVFIDRHMTIGVEWAKEIERQVRSSEAVIPLLSAASVPSEMLAFEMQVAHDAAQQQNGKPRLLPVRINYTDPLPPELGGILDPLHYFLWRDEADDERLVSELLHALRTPPALSVPLEQLEPVGGAVPLDSRFYVVRPTDDEFLAAIARRDSLVLIKGARQMGKTSLLARGIQQAREAGAQVVLTDFQKLNAAHLASLEALFRTLARAFRRQLHLDVSPDQVWDDLDGPNMNFENYIRHEVLEKTQTPIVWGLDEVDRLFTCDFGSEVFALFRSWHNERSLDPTGPWQRLTLTIAYATEPHLFITDLNMSPFNVGTRLTLEEFTLEQVADLNGRYGAPLRTAAEVERYFGLVGGHPYLVRRGLHEMVTSRLDIAAFEAQAAREEGPFSDHLRRILVLLVRDAELCDVVRGVLRGSPCPTDASFYRLRSAGILSGESARAVRLRCLLYKIYLERHLL